MAHESKMDEIVNNLINELLAAELTVDEYTLIVGLGSMAKQLQAFKKHQDLVDKINNVLIEKEYIPSKVGKKL